MELTHKTTILFSEKQFSSLKQIAKTQGRSVGELIRSACLQVYAAEPKMEAQEAVYRLERLSLPVGSVAEMKKEQISNKESIG